MTRFRVLLQALLVLLLSACASDVMVSFPGLASPSGVPETGTVLVRFSEPMRSVSVEIDGRLVTEDRHTERVLVSDVPVGLRQVAVVAAAQDRVASIDRSEAVEVSTGEEVTILVATPPRSLGSWISRAAMTLVYGALIVTTELVRN